MPQVDFALLPDGSRVWVFGSSTPLTADAERSLMVLVDGFLAQWAAHGAPLTSGRDWREHRFLTIAVDTDQEHASGCSIDGLFRSLQRFDAEQGTSLVGGGRVYYRTPSGAIETAARGDLDTLVESGTLVRQTPVFDTTLPTLGDWRGRFETAAEHSWIGALLSAGT